MSTITKFVDGSGLTQKNTPCPGPYGGGVQLIENIIDFANATGPGEVAAADVVQCLKIPANAFVIRAGVYVMTGEGATCTASFGDATANNGWKATANLETTDTSNIGLVADTYGALGGKIYGVEDTLDLTMNHAADAAKLCVWALIAQFGTDLT
jgi:hypothetical protein